METVEFRSVKPGDRVYDGHYYAPDKWVRVRSVSDSACGPEYVTLDLGYCKWTRHGREGVAVKRGE